MGSFMSKSSQLVVPVVKDSTSYVCYTDHAIISTMEDLQLPTSIIVKPSLGFVSAGNVGTASNV